MSSSYSRRIFICIKWYIVTKCVQAKLEILGNACCAVCNGRGGVEKAVHWHQLMLEKRAADINWKPLRIEDNIKTILRSDKMNTNEPEVSPVQDKNTTEQLEELKKSVTVDTLHNDEALKVLVHYQGNQEWSEEEERVLVRKIDWRLLSILCLTYGLQYYDKAMLSQAVSKTSAPCGRP